jgi:hypothetical protein
MLGCVCVTKKCWLLLLLLLQFLDFFLRGNLSLEKHLRRKPHDWLPVQGWQDLMRLTELAAAKQAPGGENCTSICKLD